MVKSGFMPTLSDEDFLPLHNFREQKYKWQKTHG
jgi:hypothetical protein